MNMTEIQQLRKNMEQRVNEVLSRPLLADEKNTIVEENKSSYKF